MLLSFDEVSLAFGDQKILDRTSFTIEPRERVCLIGRNGAGKSSMLKLIMGSLDADHGEIIRAGSIHVSQLEQSLPSDGDITVYNYVAAGLGELQKLISEYEQRSSGELNALGLRKLEELQRDIDAHGGWNIEQRIDTTLSELNLPPEPKLNELSGGWQRRVALARALVSKPDLLLLDEPTNHLDLSAIEWLENKIQAYPGSVLFITHDRVFLDRIATRIVELDRCRLSSWPGKYSNYLKQKNKALEDEERNNKIFDKKLAKEEVWVRQGIKARRTRNEGRVRALQEMRLAHASRLKRQDTARVDIEEAEQSGRKVIEARNITHGYNEEILIDQFSIKIMRGDRIGLIGNNGVGKSTLLRILLGQLTPNFGSVKLGTNLQIAYFDQLRQTLDPEKTIAETVGDGREYITINGKERHIIGYLKGFLFSAKRAMTPIKSISGGECNRVILAKLFTRPSNLLVLDEPTNDLDVETLEVLEARLCEYQGSLIVVSHDREFLDNIITSTLVFEGDGKLQIYAGGYSDWLKRGRTLSDKDTLANITSEKAAEKNLPPAMKPSSKLSFKLKFELEHLPGKIESLEADIDTLLVQINAPGFYQQAHTQMQPILAAHSEKQNELNGVLERWDELERLAHTSGTA